jgi:phospholipase D-like protein
MVLALLVLWVWCVFDVIRAPAEEVRYLHKLVWLLFVVLFPVGVLAWMFLGRPEPFGSRLIPPPAPSAPAPDDSPDFLKRVDDEIRRRRRKEELRGGSPERDQREIDDELRRLEEEFRRSGEDEPKP